MRILPTALMNAVLCFLLLTCALPAFAQKITVDPNAGQTPKVENDEILDTRLAQKVTYEAWHTPLKTILDDLSNSTGVSLFAGYNKMDWQVRDRKMNIYVKDVTLAQLMNSIARVMKFKWTKNIDLNPPVYRLCADRKLLAALQVESSNLDKALKREEIRRRTGLIDAFRQVENLSGPDLQALKKDNPYLYMCADSGFAKLMTAVFDEQPKLRDAFVNANRTAFVDTSTFSSSTHQLIAETIRKMWPLDHIAENRPELTETMEQNLTKGKVHFAWMTRPAEYMLRRRLFYFGNQSIDIPGEFHLLGDLRDPYSKSAQVWAKTCMDAVEKGEAPGTGWSKLTPGYWNTEIEESKEIDQYMLLDDVVEHPDEPDLHKKIDVKISEEEQKAIMEQAQKLGWQAAQRLFYQAVLKAFAEAADLNIITDSYNVFAGQGALRLSESEMYIILNKLCVYYTCNWEKHGNMLEFRRRDWFRRRASQIPDEWIKPWRKELEEKRALSLNNFASMLILTDDQIEENITWDSLLNQAIGPIWEYGELKELCRLYTHMSDTQRALLSSETGLNLSLLDLNQQKIYSDMFNYGWQTRWCSDEFSDAASGKLRMKLTANTDPDGSTSQKFTVYLSKDDDASDEQVWTIKLRKVKLPEKVDKAAGDK